MVFHQATACVKLSPAITYPINIIAKLPLGLTARHTRTMNLPIPCAPTSSRLFVWAPLVIFKAAITFLIFWAARSSNAMPSLNYRHHNLSSTVSLHLLWNQGYHVNLHLPIAITFRSVGQLMTPTVQLNQIQPWLRHTQTSLLRCWWCCWNVISARSRPVWPLLVSPTQIGLSLPMKPRRMPTSGWVQVLRVKEKKDEHRILPKKWLPFSRKFLSLFCHTSWKKFIH